MSRYKVLILFSLLGFVVNFNLFISPLAGFISSVLLYALINLGVWWLLTWFLTRYTSHSQASNWAAGVFVFLLSIYGYGMHFFPAWIADNLMQKNDAAWMDQTLGLFKKIFVALVIVLPATLFFIARKEKGRSFLNSFLIFAILIVTANRAWSYYKTYTLFVPQQEINLAGFTPANDTLNKPDIYYFIMDGYTGNSALKQYWNYDNSSFTNELNQLDFKVADSARTNMAATIGVLSAVLNLSVFNNPGLYDHNMDLITRTRVRDNVLFNLLKKNGYTIATNSIFFDQKPYFFTQGDSHPKAAYFSNLITRHLVFRLALRLSDRLTGFVYKDHSWSYAYDKRVHANILHQIDSLPTTPAFFYNHLMITHPVYSYTATGERLDLDHTPSGKNNYLDQVKYTNTLCLEYFNGLMAAYKQRNKALVIIAQADHGSKEIGVPGEDSQIQLMVYDSQHKIDNIGQQEDGVNLMRKVASTYLGYPLAPQPYTYYNVFGGH